MWNAGALKRVNSDFQVLVLISVEFECAPRACVVPPPPVGEVGAVIILLFLHPSKEIIIIIALCVSTL